MAQTLRFNSSDGLDAAQRGRHHVAVLKSGDKASALFRIVAQPMQQLRESPLMRIDAAAPIDAFKAQRVCLGGDLFGLGKGAMIAP